MGVQTNLTKRPGSSNWYVRLAVPPDLQAHFGKKGKLCRERWKSTETSKVGEARQIAATIIADWYAEFAETRRRLAAPVAPADPKPLGREITADDMNRIAWAEYERELGEDHFERTHLRHVPASEGFDPPPRRDPDLQRRSREIRAQAIREHLAIGETLLAHAAVDEFVREQGLAVQEGTPEHRELAHYVMRAQLEAIERHNERDRGNWAGKPADPAVAPPSPTAGPVPKPGERLADLYERFKREATGAIRPDTREQNELIVKRFIEFVGADAHVSAVNRTSLSNWKAALAKWPTKVSHLSVFAGLDFNQIVKKNETIGRDVISEKKTNKYIGAVGVFGSWLLANTYIDQDITAGMYLSIDKRIATRRPFTIDELKTLFSSPLYTGCKSADTIWKPGTADVRDWQYWLPLICLFTGARLGEVAQLLAADVTDLHGHPAFVLTEEGDESKTLKTAGSARVVPVSSRLVALGFMEYVAAQRAAGQKRLFPEILPDARGFYSGVPSKVLNNLLRHIGLKTDKMLTMHSLRHSAADAFRQGGFGDEEFAPLLGHGKTTTTSRYGNVPQGTFEKRRAMIEGMKYPELDLSHLHQRKP